MPTPITLRRRLLFAAALLCALGTAAFAQKEAPATVSGRVTDGERGAQGVTVMLIHTEPPQRFRLAARARTDAEGRFLLTNVAPGRYQLMPVAPAYVVEGVGTGFPPGRPLNITAGEEIRDIDFKMEAGGVITGRVTDADGNPVVAQAVMAQPVEETEGPPRFNFDSRDMQTDDRGVYRIFGLPPGRYRVWAGNAGDSGAVSYGRRKLFRRTFHPDATEQAQARVVEVRSGVESADVDIKVGRPLKTYRVSGRFVTADTNEPVAGVTVGYSVVDARGRRMGGYGGASTTNARGEFVTDGLAPGRYVVHASNAFGPQQETSVLYSEPVSFEVAEADVSGLLVKLKRGATVSGVVTIEGVADRAAAAQMLSAVRIYPMLDIGPRRVALPGPLRPVTVNADGTFQLSGIVPGKLRIGTMNETVKGLSTTRIELNGANVAAGFDVAEGAQITGVHIVMTLGTAVLVGQITYVNGAPPQNARVMAFARLVGATPGPGATRSAEVDARGLFRIEGMPAGEYEVFVQVLDFTQRPGGGPRVRPARSEPQRVVVGEGGETKVSPVVNFQPEPRKEP